jgi:multicomponent Na+:H+ antiporter subunit E
VRFFLLNLVLAILWAVLMGSVDRANLVVGFVLGYGALWLIQPALGETRYFRRLPRAFGLLAYFLKELALSNLVVAREVLSPRPKMRPGVVAVPLEAKTDAEITLLSIAILLTPGTLVLDVSDDRTKLYVHTMFLDSAEKFRRTVKEGFERRILEMLR